MVVCVFFFPTYLRHPQQIHSPINIRKLAKSEFLLFVDSVLFRYGPTFLTISSLSHTNGHIMSSFSRNGCSKAAGAQLPLVVSQEGNTFKNVTMKKYFLEKIRSCCFEGHPLLNFLTQRNNFCYLWNSYLFQANL